MGADGIREILDILSAQPTQIQVLLEWPRQIVTLDHELVSPLDVSIDPMLI